ncbi:MULTISPECIES: hypothetical protein [unclassified Synechococcus]
MPEIIKHANPEIHEAGFPEDTAAQMRALIQVVLFRRITLKHQ